MARGGIAGGLLGKFNVTLDWFCGRTMSTLVDSMRENNDVIPSKVRLAWGSGPHRIRSSLGLGRAHMPETASRSVHHFVGLTVVRNRQTDRPRYTPSAAGTAAWLSGSALVSINEVTLRRARLVGLLGWVTVCERVNHLVCNQPLRPIQPSTLRIVTT